MADEMDADLLLMSPSFCVDHDLFTEAINSGLFQNDPLDDLGTPDSNNCRKRSLSHEDWHGDLKKSKLKSCDVPLESLAPTLEMPSEYGEYEEADLRYLYELPQEAANAIDTEVNDALFGQNNEAGADHVQEGATAPPQELDAQDLDDVHYEQDFDAPIADGVLVHQDLDGQAQPPEANFYPVDEELEDFKYKLGKLLESVVSYNITQFITTFVRDTQDNYVKNDTEQVIRANIETYSEETLLFGIELTIYSKEAQHPGNRSTTLCSIDDGNQWIHFEIANVMMTILDFNKAIGQRRVYMNCLSQELAEQIVDNANRLGKLALENCDELGIKVNEDKWKTNLNGKSQIYKANQIFGGKHWTNRSLDHFALYLKVSKEIETEMQEVFGKDITYEQICSDEFKTNDFRIRQWKTFRRHCKENILQTNASYNTFVACLDHARR